MRRSGEKDRHPFPVPLKTYDESLGVLRRALNEAKVGRVEKMDGFRRLDGFVRMIERRCAHSADFQKTITHERAISASLDGGSVFDDTKKSPRVPANGQLSLLETAQR